MKAERARQLEDILLHRDLAQLMEFVGFLEEAHGPLSNDQQHGTLGALAKLQQNILSTWRDGGIPPPRDYEKKLKQIFLSLGRKREK